MTEVLTVQSFSGLTPTEKIILGILIGNQNRSTTAEEILNTAWEAGTHHDRRTVAVHICDMRQKIAPHRIDNVRRQGYRFIPV